MRRFAALYAELDATRSTDRKVAALEGYFRDAPREDACWALFLLTGRRLQRTVAARTLASWALAVTRVEPWLLEPCYAATGDLAETIALLVDAAAPGPRGEDAPLGLAGWVERLRGLPGLAADEQAARVAAWWRGLPCAELFLLVKMLTGELRVGVSRTLVERALGRASGLAATEVARRLAGPWEPTPAVLARLFDADAPADPTQPAPFMLASPLEASAAEVPAGLGEVGRWHVEWKWDGIRAQALRRGGVTALWSRGEELITERFPEVRRAVDRLPDGTVLDGELLLLRGDLPLPFAELQRRIGRTRLPARLLRELPATLLAFDCLAARGEDLRDRPLDERRARLAEVLAALPDEARAALRPAPALAPATWAEAAAARAGARERGVEGLMLKRRDGRYLGGRRRGEWWKWKLDPHTFDAVLVAAEPGHGRRASLYTDLTFGVWDGGELVTVAKAYSGLTDDELERLDRWVRRHTVETFGPVRTVEPVHVFELACEGVARSARHRAGLAVRFPRIARWRTDKRPPDADPLDALRAWLPPEPPPPRPEDVPGAQLRLF